jgi:2-oxoisovalerate dehydrogenase E1 component beta subunit
VLCLILSGFIITSFSKLGENGIDGTSGPANRIIGASNSTIIERAKRNGKILLVTEDNLEGSVMSEVSAIIAEHCS